MLSTKIAKIYKYRQKAAHIALGIIILTGGLLFLFNRSAQAGWYNSAWSYRKQLTVDHTKVSNSDQTDFPVMVCFNSNECPNDTALKGPNNGGHVALESGNDIIFTGSDGTTLLNYEVEKYQPIDGLLVAWVKISSLSHSTDTTFYMYYGNASASANTSTNIHSTWSNSYAAAWHLSDSTTATTSIDSTGNRDLTKVSATSPQSLTTGQIGGSHSYNGTSDFDSYATNVAFGSASFTISAWAQLTSTNAANSVIFVQRVDATGAGNPLVELHFNATNQPEAQVRDNVGATVNATDPTARNLGVWYYFTAVKTSSNLTLYINGSQVANPSHTLSGDFAASTVYRFIGKSKSAGADTGFFKGSIDEVDIATTNRSVDWILTQYNNQSSPSTFFIAANSAEQNGAPNTPNLTSPTAAQIGLSTTPSFSFNATDPQSDDVRYNIQIDTSSSFNSQAGNPLLDKISGTDAGFSGSPDNTDPFTSGQSVSYTVQSANALTAATTYYWRVRAKDPTGSNSYGSWSSGQAFTVDTSPAVPTLISPTGSNISSLPVFALRSSDADSDYLKYEIQVCSDSGCSSPIITVCQVTDGACTGSQTGWGLQNSQSQTAYTSSSTLSSSQIASFTYQSSFTALSSGTTYYWRAKAIDPGGINSWTSFSSPTQSFTITSQEVKIHGNVNIHGNTNIH